MESNFNNKLKSANSQQKNSQQNVKKLCLACYRIQSVRTYQQRCEYPGCGGWVVEWDRVIEIFKEVMRYGGN